MSSNRRVANPLLARQRPNPDCHTPTKHAYRSKAQARRAQRQLQLPEGLKKHLDPYECRTCGQWHLTSPPPADQRRIAAKLARHQRKP